MYSVRCGRCGSRRVRRSHTPAGWPQYVRRWTPLRRYACGTCGFRGWTLHQFRVKPEEQVATTARPLEARDLRHRYARRRAVMRVVLVAAALGAATGYFLFHGGG